MVHIISLVARTNTDVNRRLRLFYADCAARVLHIYEENRYSYLSAVIMATYSAANTHKPVTLDNLSMGSKKRNAAWKDGRRADKAFVDATVNNAPLEAAKEAMGEAAKSAVVAAVNFGFPDESTPGWAVEAAARAAEAASINPAAAVILNAGWVPAARKAAIASEEGWQFDRIIARLSDNEPEDWPLDLDKEKVACGS